MYVLKEDGVWSGDELIMAMPSLDDAYQVRRFYLFLLYLRGLSAAQFTYASIEARIAADAVRNAHFALKYAD